MFRFNTVELCPTIEEFFSILGYDPSRKSVAVSCDPRHKESLSDALGLPTSIIDSMIKGYMVNLRAIVSRLIDKRTYRVMTICRKTSIWPYASWENFCFALEDVVLWMLKP